MNWDLFVESVIALAAVVGVGASMFFSRETLRELRADRARRDKPYLAFERNTWNVEIRLLGAGSDDLIGSVALRAVLRNVPEGASIAMPARATKRDGYGALRNFGPGAATETTVTFRPHDVSRRLPWGGPGDPEDSPPNLVTDPMDAVIPNTVRARPGHIAHGETARLTDLPDVFTWDYKRDVASVSGTVEIRCRDIGGTVHEFTQAFMAIPLYSPVDPVITLSFGSTDRQEPRSTTDGRRQSGLHGWARQEPRSMPRPRWRWLVPRWPRTRSASDLA